MLKTSVSHTQRYIPHSLNTRFYSVNLYRKRYPISFVCRSYKISKSSLIQWNRRFDGTKESLVDKSHSPISKHPNAHTDTEIKWIKDLIRRNPHISMSELYGKLRTEYGYSRHAASLFRLLRNIVFYVDKEKHKKYVPKSHDTPTDIGIKWQLDVKYVPKECYSGTGKEKFYQYTVIDEATRERFIYPYKEQSSYSTVDFIKRAIVYFGYKPKIIQTDNGFEFTHHANTRRMNPFNVLCNELDIEHKLIRLHNPRHSGKGGKSHKNDQNTFYNYLNFYSYEDLKVQMKAYLKRSNNIPMQVLDWSSPIVKRYKIKEASAIASLPN